MLKTGDEMADRFTLLRLLGGADDAPVWEAQDGRTNSPVALKLQLSTPKGAPLAAQYEASRALTHPAIARPLEYLREDGLECLVMPLAAGGNLGSLRGRSYRAFLPQLRTLAQAVGYLHSQGLVHGDLKPSNVLLDAQGEAQLSDFGNLKPIGAARSANEPFSPFSASPQQRALGPAQPSDDIYSFGALLHELLFGQPPHYASAVSGAQAPAPTDVQPAQPAPPRLIDLMRRCLKDFPEQRPSSMQEITLELEQIAASNAPALPPNAPALTPPKSAADVLRPTWQRTASVAAPDPKALQRQGFKSGVAVAVVSVLAIVALALFIVPARHAALPALPPARENTPTPAPAQPAEGPVDLQALAKQKSAADAQRASVGSRLSALRNAGSESWATEGTAAALAAMANVDALMQKREYRAAQQGLTELSRELGRSRPSVNRRSRLHFSTARAR